MGSRSNTKSMVLTIVVVIIILAALFFWYNGARRTASRTSTALTPVHTQDLGSKIYVQANNPIQDKLPSTVSPVPNPADTLYKNPFQ